MKIVVMNRIKIKMMSITKIAVKNRMTIMMTMKKKMVIILNKTMNNHWLLKD